MPGDPWSCHQLPPHRPVYQGSIVLHWQMGPVTKGFTTFVPCCLQTPARASTRVAGYAAGSRAPLRRLSSVLITDFSYQRLEIRWHYKIHLCILLECFRESWSYWFLHGLQAGEYNTRLIPSPVKTARTPLQYSICYVLHRDYKKV